MWLNELPHRHQAASSQEQVAISYFLWIAQYLIRNRELATILPRICSVACWIRRLRPVRTATR
jgi:hypothetical protein